MTSTFTPNKNIEKPAHGDYNNDWDIPLNADMDDIDTALGGSVSIVITGIASGTYALSLSQYRPSQIIFFGTFNVGVTLNFFLPSGVGGLWSIRNDVLGTTGTIRILSAGGGSFVTLPQRTGGNIGPRTFIVCDGSNVEFAQTANTSSNPSQFIGLTAKNGTATTFMTSDSAPPLDQSINPVWTGTHSFNLISNINNLQFCTLTGSFGGFTGSVMDLRQGTLLVPTQSPGNNDTHAATTAFVATSFAPLASPILSGTPLSTTAPLGSITAQIANAAFVNPNFGSNGNGRWRQHPDGSMEMWGLAAGSAGAPGTQITFPTAFPNACESVQVTQYGSSTATVAVYTDGGAHQTSTTSFWLINGIGGNCYWFAAGH
jgi:hypothetical protein